MPRIHNPTTLRSRNRVTNKTRLKIHIGDIDFDPDDTPITISNDTAGVDAEDANEHHLQAVLSAASQQNNNKKPTTREGNNTKPSAPVPTAYIPTPDSTGVVDGFEAWYPSEKWTDPATYIKASETVDEAVDGGLASMFTYFMDERDQEWLEKNNEEARGEGTSAQGALNGTSTRSGGALRSSNKGKGKEPEITQPLTMSENEFELVMGLFEKITHEKTEFLHHGLEQGMAFPPFSDYQETLSAPLPAPTWATFTPPSWLPSPSHLTRLAKVVYPYWRERRIERGGHRIIPILNYDETDSQNESYICFRRREIKAVRKTRASQVTSSDKLLRLQSELLSSLDLAKNVLSRENLKRDAAKQAQNVWEKRLTLVDLKRRFPTLGTKEDEELLHDKERVPKRPKFDSASAKLPGLRIRTHGGDLASPSAHTEIAIRPKDRTATIQSSIERELLRQKDRDHHWEDQIDNVYQPSPVPYPSRLFKYIRPSQPSSASSSQTDEEEEAPRAIRIRRARGGRWFIDKRAPPSRSDPVPEISSIFSFRRRLPGKGGDEDDDMDEERAQRLAERWKFDADDGPIVGPNGTEEQDRVLVDDFDPKFLRHTMSLLHPQDTENLVTDNSLTVVNGEGRMQTIIPYRLGMVQPGIRRDPQMMQRAMGIHPSQLGGTPINGQMPSGTPISVQTQMMKMQSMSQPQPRISSNGGMRQPTTPSISATSQSSQTSPPQAVPQPAGQPPNGVNGTNHSPSRPQENETPQVETPTNGMMPNGTTPSTSDANLAVHPAPIPLSVDSHTPPRPHSSQSQNLTVPMQNGFHVPQANGFTNGQNGSMQMNMQNGLSMQQRQFLKSAFAGNPQMQGGQDQNQMLLNGNRGMQNSYMGPPVANGTHFNMPVNGGNLNLKLPPNRQTQWSIPAPLQHQGHVNGAENVHMNGSMSPSPVVQHSVPMRTPSANGSRNGVRQVSNHMMGGQMSISPYLQHSPSPMPMNGQQSAVHLSPPRPSPTPPMSMVSPSLQHQQMVGGPQNGY